ncbi:erythroid membrane-associated protein-like isoform X4 [Polyodon spathula]|uniref:erythroid membrane-associated protein-like isoform X4 n=1 Tax=Polyodon spathula TaxID=7913 RepID=UPI001B7EC161|nr:erythroid membrane-associated protein-like isoform X4 [Polyodon spathula]
MTRAVDFLYLLSWAGSVGADSLTVKVLGSPLIVREGEDAVLPCLFLSPDTNAESLEVKWYGVQETLVHTYLDHKDVLDAQIDKYKGRTSLFQEELRKGNVSLQIRGVRISDKGSYSCCVISAKQMYCDKLELHFPETFEISMQWAAIANSLLVPVIVIAALCCCIRKLTKEKKALQKENERLGRENERLGKEKQDLQKKNETLAIEKQTAQAEKQDLQKKNETLAIEKQTAQAEKKALQKENERLGRENERLGKETLKKQKENVEAEKQDLQKKNETLEIEKQTAQAEKKALQKENERLGRENERLGKEKQDLQKKNETLAIEKQTAQAEKKALQKENERLGRENERLGKETLKKQKENVEADLKDLRQKTNTVGYVLDREWKLITEPRVKVTPDPDTASPSLTVSEDGSLVRFTGERSEEWPSVVGREGFTSGRCYWEVEVGEKGYWVLGVSTHPHEKSIPEKPEEGYWLVRLVKGKTCRAVSQSGDQIVQLEKICKVWGVYLDHEGGRLSFYNAETRFHIYTFEGSFPGQVYPIFSPGSYDKGPLIIQRVQHT